MLENYFNKENFKKLLNPVLIPFNKILKILDDFFKFKIVTKYILKEYLTTFSIAFLFFFIIFFINQILLNIELLLKKSIPFNLIMDLVVTFFPEIFIFSLPFGVMLATLMVMGRFSSDNEIIAFRALGINLMNLFIPVFICGLITTVITFLIFDQFIPAGYNQRRKVLIRIAQIKPTLDFKSKTIKKYDNDKKVIYTNIVKASTIEGLFIIDRDENNDKRIISSEKAEIISPKDRKGVIELKMQNSMFQFINKDRPNEFNFGYSETLSYFFNFLEFFESESKTVPDRYKTTIEIFKNIVKYRAVREEELKISKVDFSNLKQDIRDTEYKNEQYLKDNISDKDYLETFSKMDVKVASLLELKKGEKVKYYNLIMSLLEFYNKFTTSLACIIFAIFAAPIGIYSRRAGFQIGFILGLFLSAVYWFSLAGSYILGQRFILIPFLAMLSPNLIFFIVGIIFLLKRLKE